MILYPTRIIFFLVVFLPSFFYPAEIHLNGGGSNGGACNNNNNIIPKVGWLSCSSPYTKRLFFKQCTRLLYLNVLLLQHIYFFFFFSCESRVTKKEILCINSFSSFLNQVKIYYYNCWRRVMPYSSTTKRMSS